MTDLVEPRLKPDPVECVCGCGLASTLRSKAWNDGLGPHVRGCACPRCRGARNRRGGMAKQRAARKPLGIKAQRVGNGNEEYWDDPLFANEVKSGKQVGPLVNWWNRVQAQVQANQADFGSIRKPTRAVAMPPGWGNRGLVVVETETWRTLILPALEAMYGS
jgi:hypothetical protein